MKNCDPLDRMTTDEVRRALASLSDAERRILELRFVEGLTQVQASKRIGWGLAKISHTERRGLRRLRYPPRMRELGLSHVLEEA